MKDNFKKGEVIIYKAKDGPRLDVRMEKDAVWLRQNEIADLFGKDRSVVTKHINSIFGDKEVDKENNVHFLHIPNSDKLVAFYSLDVILAVGYRTNSSRAIHFRQWATKILKKYLLKGYVLNEKRLIQAQEQSRELQETIALLKEKSGHELLTGKAQEILRLLADYAKTLTLLEQYDKGTFPHAKKTKGKFVLNYQTAHVVINELKKELMVRKEAGDLFGQEYGEKFKGILGSIQQTFGGKELYPSVGEKAAHLLYFIIKDHPFADGNKRIGAFLFVYFLDRNAYGHKASGEKKINDNALTALALLIAVSDPQEKEKLIKIVMHLLSA